MSAPRAGLPALARALRAGEVSAKAVAEAALAARRAALDAYVSFEPERVLEAAEAADEALALGADPGPMLGIPVSVKDLFGVPGYPTHAGTPRPLPAPFTEPGPVVQALLQQLAVITGKTHTVELAFGGIGANAHWPTPKNPWDAASHRVPGGSSSGAAVSVAEGSALVGIGSDTAGSVRIPAAWNGLVGLKTTAGRWSTAGVVPLSHTLDTVGVITRTVEDARYVFGALDAAAAAPAAPPPSALRLGVVEDPLFEALEPGVGEAVQVALRELEAAGVSVEASPFAPAKDALALFAKGSVAAAELWAFLNRALPGWIDTLEPRVRARVEAAEQMPAREYLDRLHTLETLAAAAGPAFEGYDALVAPTVANSPPRLSEVEDVEAYGKANLLALRNTSVANTLRLCAVTVPVGKDAHGMPVGLMLMGRGLGEARLLAVAQAVEGVLGAGQDRLGSPPRL